MSYIVLPVNTAVVVPVSIVPIVDAATGATMQAVAYNAAGMDLRWNFVTAAGVTTSTAVTPTTASNHDWVDLGDGICSMELPASGGTVNNNTVGYGWWSGKVTASLPFASPIYQFTTAQVVDSIIKGTDLLQVDLANINNSATLLANFAANVEQMIRVTVDTTAVAATATSFESSTVTDLDGAAVEATANHFVDRLLLWSTGPLAGKVTRINGYSVNGGRGVFTMTDKGEAPANGNIALLV